MRIAVITTDGRWMAKRLHAKEPMLAYIHEVLARAMAASGEHEVHVLSCSRGPVSSPAKLAGNVWFHSLHVPKMGWMRTGYQGCIRAVRRKCKEIQPDIVHGQGTELDCAMDAVFSGFPNVLTIHGNMRRIAKVTKARPFSFGWFAARLETLAVSRAGGVVCISSHTQRAVENLARRSWVVPNALQPSFFEIQSQPAPGEPPRILCVARVTLLKNQNALIQALDSLASKRGFQLVFLGAAPQEDAYAAEFLRLVKSRPWCRHVGHVNPEEIREYLRSASLLALPSLEENCPMSVLEAMAAGVPVAAARVGGVPDLIEDGKSGFLFDPLDAGSMRATIERALANPAAALEIAGCAKKLARQRFHPEVVAREHFKIYEEVLHGSAQVPQSRTGN